MTKRQMRLVAVLAGGFWAMEGAQGAVFSATGANAAAIQGTVNNFRAALGANNGVGGTFASGRREINWDGVPAGFTDPSLLPANFFNSNSPRGMELTGASGFMVSSTDFSSINPAYAGQFQEFSSPKLFTGIGNRSYDLTFFIPGTAIQTTITSFGAVFTDIEITNSTILQFFDENLNNMGQFGVPVSGDGGLSFLGLTFPGQTIKMVRIFQGTHALSGSNVDGSGVDIVVADDFIFDEPFNPNAESVPEPSTLGLLGAGAAVIAGLNGWRGRRS
ncbi:MAG: PEP-CTERM sorting domain-containing protein [Acidobacteria bacterium]|nr:PEP-CTERM sorting domain-containing protein [Acidobacteriota bacterium]